MNRGEGDGEERRAAEIFAVIARSGRSCASMRSRHLHILVRRSDVAIQRFSTSPTPSIEPTRISNQLNSACRLLCPPGCSNLVLPFLVAGNDYVSKPTAAGWRRLNACICRYGR